MKLFKSLLVAPAALGLLTPFSASANEVNLNDISNYSDIEGIELANSFDEEESIESTLLAGGEGLVDSYDGSFSTTTTASFGADFVVGSVDGAGISATSSKEAVTFDYQYGMSLSTSFTGEDSLDLTIETGNADSTVGSSAVLNMNSMGDKMTLDGITYTFPLGDSATVMVGDSTDVSALYSTACTYSAFTDILGNCGSGNAAGLGGGGTTSISSATIAASYDFGNGFTVAGGLSGEGEGSNGLFTKEGMDVYGVQAAYNTDTYGASLSYALTDTSETAETTYWGFNAFYSFDGEGLPSISVGYESEDPSASATEEGYFVGLTWDSVGPGSLSVGMSSLENYTSAQTEYYQYEAAYSYPINDGVTITPGVFIKEGSTDQTGVIVKTSFSF
tara:strand:+ start:325 stop:1494 length:1170 start_codon:yes stop_codon:yes gene_type:complete